MAWTAARRSAHHQMKLCKDEQGDQLVLGLISPGLPSASQDMVPLSRKRPHLVYQKGDFIVDDDDIICDELLTNATEKKRRLTIEQVKYLEMSFSVDLKLEPERKALIAKHLGLRPRQVAIWFQNRRARWKNKQLEQDYEALKAKYEATVRENEDTAQRIEVIMEENKRLHAEISHLTGMIRERDLPIIVNVMGGSVDDEPTLSLPDSDADSDSGLKEEQHSAKSELASPTKSDDQSEMQDSCHSYRMSDDAIMAVVDRPTGDVSSVIACTTIKYEADDGPLSPFETVHVNPSLLIQQYVNGFHAEDLFYSWDDHACGFAWGVQ